MTEIILVQSIIEKKTCYHVNCDGGAYVPHKIGKIVVVEDTTKFSNLGTPCPLYPDCMGVNLDNEAEEIVKLAKKWMKKKKKMEKNAQ